MNYDHSLDQKVLEVYENLKLLAQVEDNPCVSQNAKRALASVWQIVNGLGLKFEQLYDLGV